MIWLLVLAVILSLQFTVFFGPPYLPTRRRQREAALELLDLKAGQTLLDLGCGDGSLLRLAAERGICGIGYDINPLLVLVARLRTRKYRDKVKIIRANFWRVDWPKADGIFVFLSQHYNHRLAERMLSYKGGVKLASYGFAVPDKKPIKKKAAIFLYHY